MARQLIMLVRADTRRDVMKDRGRDNGFGIRHRRKLLHRLRSKRYGVGKGNKDQSECNEAPAVVAHVVCFEVVGCEVKLRGGTEPLEVLLVWCELGRVVWRGSLFERGLYTYIRLPLWDRRHDTSHADRTRMLCRTHMRGRPSTLVRTFYSEACIFVGFYQWEK